MAYRIETRKSHAAALKRIADNAGRRLAEQQNVEECGLSSWAGDSMARFHQLAIEAIDCGAENGMDVAAWDFTVLVDAATGAEVGKLICGQFGLCYLLSDEEAGRYGRRFVPVGERSRVQRQLGLREESRVLPVSQWVRATCACVGGAVTFCLQRERDEQNWVRLAG